MKRKDKQPTIPHAQTQTIRQQIIDHVSGAPVSIGTLSAELGLPEKQLHVHLESLQKQVRLSIAPARCGKCGFVFSGRRRTKKPGKCPKCKGTYIEEPLFSLIGDQS